MYKCESWITNKAKRWRTDVFGTVVLEKILENSLDIKKIKVVNSEGNQHWIFIGSADAEAEAPVLWPPDAKSQLIRKDPDAGKDWGHEEKGMTGWDGLDGITDSMDMGLSKHQEIVENRRAWHAAVHGTWTKNQTWLRNSTTTTTARQNASLHKLSLSLTWFFSLLPFPSPANLPHSYLHSCSIVNCLSWQPSFYIWKK